MSEIAGPTSSSAGARQSRKELRACPASSAVAFAILRFASASAASTDTLDGDNWANYGRTHDEAHYSPLADINTSNVSHLALAWWFDIPGVVLAESEPLEVDGTVYFTTGYSVVRAVDAVTGRLRWVFDPEVPKIAGHKLRLLWGVRGIAYLDHKI